MTANQTIAALATAPAPAGVAVIRVSGSGSLAVLAKIFKSKTKPASHPRTLIYGKIINPVDGVVIDRALAVFMPAESSFTGEDIVEFHTHGSPLITKQVLAALYAAGIKPAEAGEFSKRAFLNGKLDLAQAEAICDLITATSEQSLHFAEEQLAGRFSQVIVRLGEPLRDALAEIEAAIDFPDEDIEPKKLSSIRATLEQSAKEIQAFVKSYNFGAKIREGFKVLLCGEPNVGKSSILNLLLGRQRAIVSEVSGTTRDLIEEEALIEGYKFVFCDSAGLTETTDTVERIGIELAKERLSWADLVLFVVDATDQSDSWQKTIKLVQGKAKRIWMVVNKTDKNPAAIGTVYCDSSICHRNFYLSAKSGEGLTALREALIEELVQGVRNEGEANLIVTNERHKDCLNRSAQALGRTLEAINQQLPLELVSSELRLALSALEEIIGKTYTEDILGRIFSKFCIGK